MNQQGFSLTEVLIATAISSLLLISASRFLPGLQRAVLLQSGQREVKRSGKGFLTSVNIFRERDIARVTVQGKAW